MTERYTPIDANTIHYEARITDGNVFTQPVTLAWYAFARAPKEYMPLEYACFEGNAKNILLMTNTDISRSASRCRSVTRSIRSARPCARRATVI